MMEELLHKNRYVVATRGKARAPDAETPFVVETQGGWPVVLHAYRPWRDHALPDNQASLVIVPQPGQDVEVGRLLSAWLQIISIQAPDAEGVVVVDAQRQVVGLIPTPDLFRQAGPDGTTWARDGRPECAVGLHGNPAAPIRASQVWRCSLVPAHFCYLRLDAADTPPPACPQCGSAIVEVNPYGASDAAER